MVNNFRQTNGFPDSMERKISEQTIEIEHLKEIIINFKKDLRSKRASLFAREIEIAKLTEELQSLREKWDNERILAERRQSEIKELTNIARKSEDMYQAFYSLAECRRVKIDDLYESTSWKITAPIRKLKNLIILFKR